jgi:thermitase
MKTKKLALLLAAMISVITLVADEADSGSKPGYAEQVLIKFDRRVSLGASNALKAEHGLTTLATIPRINVHVLRTRQGQQSKELVQLLKRNPKVVYAEKDLTVTAFYRPDDALLLQQWALGQIRAFDCWEMWQGDLSTIVAIVDSGVDGTHPDLLQYSKYTR